MFKLQLWIIFLLFSFQLSAGEQSVYDFSWLDRDKEIFVLQNRKFQKKNRVHISGGYGTTLTGPFVSATAMQGRVGFFFAEQLGLEFIYSKNSGSNNSTYDAVRNEGGGGSIPFRRVVENYYGGQIVWSPFYAKINTFNKIIYLDWFFSVGYGKLKEHNNTDAVSVPNAALPDITEEHNTFLWGTGVKVFLSRYIDLRIDLTGAIYKASRLGGAKEAYANYDLTVSLGIALF